jgi:hypothetical protein
LVLESLIDELIGPHLHEVCPAVRKGRAVHDVIRRRTLLRQHHSDSRLKARPEHDILKTEKTVLQYRNGKENNRNGTEMVKQ